MKNPSPSQEASASGCVYDCARLAGAAPLPLRVLCESQPHATRVTHSQATSVLVSRMKEMPDTLSATTSSENTTTTTTTRTASVMSVTLNALPPSPGWINIPCQWYCK